MPGTNPFEDNDEPVTTTTSTNPFDDGDLGGPPSQGRGYNPFDNDDQDDEVEEDTFESTDGDNNLGAPVEASWQYLGDLPYRRIPVYTNVRWGGSSNETGSDFLNYGLSAFPKAALQRQPGALDARELQELLSTSTITKVVGCQYGGPIAAVTLPIVGDSSWFGNTDIRILTNSGNPLATIEFPLPEMESRYTPSDILDIGFTDRAALVIVLKDSLCLTYDLTGRPLLPPFFILPRADGEGTELFQACVFEGGAVRFESFAVLFNDSRCRTLIHFFRYDFRRLFFQHPNTPQS